MSEQEIIEGNKLIAEFMGGKYVNSQYTTKDEDGNDIIHDWWHWNLPDGYCPYNNAIVPPQQQSTAFVMSNFMYHQSWDWLIPVIGKIRSMNEYVKYKDYTCSIVDEGGIYINTRYIENTWHDVVEFIKWYNEQEI